MRYLALFTLFAALSLAAADGYRFMTLPPEREGREKIVTIAKGESVRTIARRLENENILRSDWRFRILIRFNKKQGSVQAGEFALRTDLSPYEVLRKLTSGQGVLYRLQI